MKIKRTTITLPLNLFETVIALAEKEERSLNKQILFLLKKAVENQEQKNEDKK